MSENMRVAPGTPRGEGPTDMHFIFDAVGVPREYATTAIIAHHVMPSIVTTFSDGEVQLARPDTETDPVLAEHFGSQNYVDGTFGTKVRELLAEDQDETTRYQMHSLVTFMASAFAQSVVDGSTELPLKKNIGVNNFKGLGTMLQFDGMVGLALPQPVKTVVDYGPGLMGRHHIDTQLNDIFQKGILPYQYIAVGKGPFVNHFLINYLRAKLEKMGEPDFFPQLHGKFFIGREDGIAAASADIVETAQSHFGTSETADLVVASGVFTAGKEEVGAGITNAYKMLREEGSLLIRAPKKGHVPGPDDVPAETMVEMGYAAGFREEKAVVYDTVTGSDLTKDVPSMTGLFRK